MTQFDREIVQVLMHNLATNLSGAPGGGTSDGSSTPETTNTPPLSALSNAATAMASLSALSSLSSSTPAPSSSSSTTAANHIGITSMSGSNLLDMNLGPAQADTRSSLLSTPFSASSSSLQPYSYGSLSSTFASPSPSLQGQQQHDSHYNSSLSSV
jgi:hypothetical protein